MKKILITGCAGQIGSELTLALRKIYGGSNIIASDVSPKINQEVLESGPFVLLDVLDRKRIAEIVGQFGIDAIIHLAAILSAVGEKNPQLAWDVNINGSMNIFEVAREKKLDRLLVPSSIAVFGPDSPRTNTPQKTIQRPTTIYGVTKVTTELLGNYYNRRFGMDIRGLRYPGVISYKTPPGGGTTDYAIAIYFDAVKQNSYNCFLKKDTMLPMMYMPDCIRATIELFHAERDRLHHGTGYNVAGFSVTPADVATSICKVIPDFQIYYRPDFRQAIADSWPDSLDDQEARAEWNWKPAYDLDRTTMDMIRQIRLMKNTF